MASNHPEAGLKKMPCVEYHEVPLADAGVLRDGEKDVWFKELVHDVCFGSC